MKLGNLLHVHFFAPFVWRFLTMLFPALGMLCAGCSSLSISPDYGKITALVPKPQLVVQGEEMNLAEKDAANRPGAVVFYGIGESMKPFYGDNTAVIVAPCKYENLRRGMVVIYWSSRGYRVGHMIVKKTVDGFVTQGLNNEETDEDLVTQKNLVGVVVQAYASIDERSYGAHINTVPATAAPSKPMQL